MRDRARCDSFFCRWTHSCYRFELGGVDRAAGSIVELQKGDEVGDLLELRVTQESRSLRVRSMAIVVLGYITK